MRALRRNKRKLYYALYLGKEQITEGGLRTGDYRELYGDPTELKANYSASNGEASEEVFGIGTNYSKTMVVEDKNCPIDEQTIIWIDKSPTEGGSPVKHNFVVVQKAVSVNHVMYALMEVK